MPRRNSQSQPDLLESPRDGIPFCARLLVSSTTTELPQPSDENEKIITIPRGRYFVAANTSSKASCQVGFPGLRCEFFFAPGRDTVLFDVLSYNSPPDLMSMPVPERGGQYFKALTTPKYKLPLSPGRWTLHWPDPRDQRRKLSANIVILPRSFYVTIKPARREYPALSWDHPLLATKDGESFTIRSPPRLRSNKKENYRVTCHKMLYQGNSVVFIGRHDTYGTVAVKFLKLAMGGQSAAEFAVPVRIREWTREVQTLRRLSHPNIVKYISSDARLCSVVTEYKPWDALASCLHQSHHHYFGGNEHDQRDILKGMASALHYLNSKKISHNDIRPANILFKRGQPCILLDFGSACSHDEVNLWSMCHYLCPEYLWSRRRGAKSDIFSLGVVMLWVLRQIPLPEATEWTWDAIQAASVPGSPHAIRARDWQRRLLLSRERLANHSRVKHLVYRMLDPNPETRISSQELFEQA